MITFIEILIGLLVGGLIVAAFLIACAWVIGQLFGGGVK